MPKIHVQRKVEVWVEDSYTVDEINDDIIQQAINYELPFEDSDTLWETQVELWALYNLILLLVYCIRLYFQ